MRISSSSTNKDSGDVGELVFVALQSLAHACPSFGFSNGLGSVHIVGAIRPAWGDNALDFGRLWPAREEVKVVRFGCLFDKVFQDFEGRGYGDVERVNGFHFVVAPQPPSNSPGV